MQRRMVSSGSPPYVLLRAMRARHGLRRAFVPPIVLTVIAVLSGTVLGSSFLSSVASFTSNESYALLPVGGCMISPPSGWSALAPNPARSDGPMAYDAADGYVLEFGGSAGFTTLLGDTWSYLGGCWTEREAADTGSTCYTNPPTDTTTGPCPLPRAGANMVWDGHPADCTTLFPSDTQGCVVLFGGCTSIGSQGGGFFVGGGFACAAGTFAADTWEYYGGSWAQVTTQGTAPPGRIDFGMAYDALDTKVVIVAGSTAQSCGASKCTITVTSDSWKFNGGGTNPTWTQICAAGACGSPAISSRWGPALTYDASDQELVLYGGSSVTASLGDSYTFTVAGGWSQVCSSCAPGLRAFAAFAWDPTYTVAALVGGYNSGTSTYDSSTYTFVTGTFTAGCNPCSFIGRSQADLAYDAASTDGYLLMYSGGDATVSVLGDQWLYK